MTGPPHRIGQGWRRFWFEPVPTSTLALVRIAFGLVVTCWTLSLLPVLTAFFGPDGIEPGRPPNYPGEWGLLPSPAPVPVLIGAWVVLLLAALAFTVGCYTRMAAVVVWLGVLSFEHANTVVGNAGDGLIRVVAFYLMLAPSGAALSVDRYRTARDRFWAFPARAPWALRLVQIQLSVGYLSAVWHKVQSELWREGSAVSYALRIEDIHRFPDPAFLTQSLVLTELLTFGTLALELSLAVLVWNRAARPYVLTLGVSLHLAIEYSILIGFFSLTMFVLYLAFLSPDNAARLVIALRDRVRARRAGRVGSGPPAPASAELDHLVGVPGGPDPVDEHVTDRGGRGERTSTVG